MEGREPYQARRSLGEGYSDATPAGLARRPPENNHKGWKDREGTVADPSARAAKASALFQALLSETPDINEDEIFQGPDYHERQRQFLQERKQAKVMERLERRADIGGHGGRRSSHARSSECSDGVAERRSLERRSLDRTSLDQRRSLDRRAPDRRSLERSSMDREPRSSHDFGKPSPSNPQRTSSDSTRASMEGQRGRLQQQHPEPPPPAASTTWRISRGRPQPSVPAGDAMPSVEQASRPEAHVGRSEHKPRSPRAGRTVQHLLSSITEEEMLAATSALAAVENASRAHSNMMDADAGRANGGPRAGVPAPTDAAAVEASMRVSGREEGKAAAGADGAAPRGSGVGAGKGSPSDSDRDSDRERDGGVQVAGWEGRSRATSKAPTGSSDEDLLGQERIARFPSAASRAPSVPVRQGGVPLTGGPDGFAPSASRPTPLTRNKVMPLPPHLAGAGPGPADPPAASMAALGLVEVQPLSDHIQRDDDWSGWPAQKPQGVGSGRPAEAASPTTASRPPTGDGGGPWNAGSSPPTHMNSVGQRSLTGNSLAGSDEYGDVSQYNPVRRFAVRLNANPDFEMLVTAVIFGNCLTLCLFNPREPDSEGLNRKLFWAELAFNICFSVEMILRVVAMGSPWAYIRRPWNQFDFFMVVAGYTVFVPGNSSAVNAIRALRALRPLRTITRFESLRGVIVCFLEAIPLLASVGGLLIFFVFLYAVAAVQLFPKTYHWTCLEATTGEPLNIGEDPDEFGCGGSGDCPSGYNCTLLPYETKVNVAGFDNTGLAMLSVWQALTLTGWVYMMYRTIDAYSMFAVIYYVTLIFIGAYFVLNLFLAVLKIKFAKAQTLFHNQLALQRNRKRQNTFATLMGRVKSRISEYSAKRSQASLLNSKLSSAISSRIGSVASQGPPSPRMLGGQVALKAGADPDGAPRLSGKGGSPSGTGSGMLPSSDGSSGLGGKGCSPKTTDHGMRGGDGADWSGPFGRKPGSPSRLRMAPMGNGTDGTSSSSGDSPPRARKPGPDGGPDRDGDLPGSDEPAAGPTVPAGAALPAGLSPAASLRRMPSRSALASTRKPPGLKVQRSMRSVSFRNRDVFMDDPYESGLALRRRAVTAAAAAAAPADGAAGARPGAEGPAAESGDSPRRPGSGPVESSKGSHSTGHAEGGGRASRPQASEGGAPVAEASEEGYAVHSGSGRAGEIYGGEWGLGTPVGYLRAGQGSLRQLDRADAGSTSLQRFDLKSDLDARTCPEPRSCSFLSVASATNSPAGLTNGYGFGGVWQVSVRRLQPPPQQLEPVRVHGASAAPVSVAAHRSLVDADGLAGPCSSGAIPGSVFGTRTSLEVERTAVSAAASAARRSSAVTEFVGPPAATSGSTAAPFSQRGSGTGFTTAAGFPSSNSSASRRSTAACLVAVAGPGPVAEAVRFVGGSVKNDESTLAPGDGRGGPGADAGQLEGRATTISPAQSGRTVSGRPDAGGGGDASRTNTGGGARGTAHGDADDVERTYSAAPPTAMDTTNVAMIVMTAAEFDEFVADHPYFQRQMLQLQYRVRILVNHNLFNQVFMLFIFVNTVLLAIEHDNQPASLTNFLTIANYVLTGLFTSEMLLKMFGLGFWDYIRDGFNIFDAVVVAVSLLEIVLATVGGMVVARALRVLKALRVLRLFKLFRYMQSLRRIGEVLLSAFMSFAAIATLLSLFWIVFAIIGMHVFGSEDLSIYPWPNFSTFLFSLTTTWNVLNLENWTNIMYATVRVTNYGSSMFFVLWIIIGRYILLTLFLAVTLEAFEAKYDPNAVRIGAKGAGLTSILGSLMSGNFSRASSRASSAKSSRNSSRDNSVSNMTRLKEGGAAGGGGNGGGAGGNGAKDPGPDVLADSPMGRPPVLATGGGVGVAMGADGRPVQNSALRPGTGQLADAQAAASSPYGDDPSVLRGQMKMHSIKLWIDTGNMGVLTESPEPGVAPRPSDDAGRSGGPRMVSDDGAATPNGPGAERMSTPSPKPRSMVSGHGTPGGAGACGGLAAAVSAGRHTRGVPYINDSAAQSRASSDEAGAMAARADKGGAGNETGGEVRNARRADERRPVAEAVEEKTAADPALIAPVKPAATSKPAAPKRPAADRPPRADSAGAGTAGTGGSASVSSSQTAGPQAAAPKGTGPGNVQRPGRGPGPTGAAAAPALAPPGPGAASSAGQAARSRLMRSHTAVITTSVAKAESVVTPRLTSPQEAVDMPAELLEVARASTAASATKRQRAAPGSRVLASVGAGPGRHAPPPSAPAPVRFDGFAPEDLGPSPLERDLLGFTDSDDDSDGPAAGGHDGHRPGTRSGAASLGGEAVTGAPPSPALWAEASGVGGAPPSPRLLENDVIMATFHDMLTEVAVSAPMSPGWPGAPRAGAASRSSGSSSGGCAPEEVPAVPGRSAPAPDRSMLRTNSSISRAPRRLEVAPEVPAGAGQQGPAPSVLAREAPSALQPDGPADGARQTEGASLQELLQQLSAAMASEAPPSRNRQGEGQQATQGQGPALPAGSNGAPGAAVPRNNSRALDHASLQQAAAAGAKQPDGPADCAAQPPQQAGQPAAPASAPIVPPAPGRGVWEQGPSARSSVAGAPAQGPAGQAPQPFRDRAGSQSLRPDSGVSRKTSAVDGAATGGGPAAVAAAGAPGSGSRRFGGSRSSNLGAAGQGAASAAGGEAGPGHNLQDSANSINAAGLALGAGQPNGGPVLASAGSGGSGAAGNPADGSAGFRADDAGEEVGAEAAKADGSWSSPLAPDTAAPATFHRRVSQEPIGGEGKGSGGGNGSGSGDGTAPLSSDAYDERLAAQIRAAAAAVSASSGRTSGNGGQAKPRASNREDEGSEDLAVGVTAEPPYRRVSGAAAANGKLPLHDSPGERARKGSGDRVSDGDGSGGDRHERDQRSPANGSVSPGVKADPIGTELVLSGGGGGGGPGGAVGAAQDDGGRDARRDGDKGPPRRVSDAGSVANSDAASRADSYESRASAASRGSMEEDDQERRSWRRGGFRKRRRASILIEGTGKSFWIWDEDHPAREWTYWLVTNKRFEYTMFAFILMNCVTMALENPYIVPGSPMDKALYWSNVGFTIIFTIEALLKIFAYTFVAYIKRITNQVDFLIVVTSLVEVLLAKIATSIDAVSALRALRAIKPLRLLTRSAGMRLVFKSVTMSLMSMANVSIVCILFFLIFAILGVQLFSGRFYRCNDESVPGQEQCVGDFFDSELNQTVPRTWTNDYPNFDNTGSALLCCFITATLNGYTEIMINAMSAPQEKGFQPKEFQNPGAFFWFFGFIVVCAFTLLNLYVGVIFSQFSKIRMLSETGSAFLTSDQNEWAELTKMVFRLKPPDKTQLPSSRLRRFFYLMVHSKHFDVFILAIILINVAFLAATWYGEPASYTHKKEVANIVFMGLFAAEAGAKIFALGWAGYFKVAWNKLDFLLLVLGIVDLVVSMLQSNFLRILRIVRIQKLIALVRISHFAQLVKSVKGIQSLFSTLIYSLPAFGNVGALIGLFFFMYAYVGMYLFGKVQYGESLSPHVNFHNFFQALLVLLRVATGDNWSGIMFDCMVQPPVCDRSAGGCGTYLSIPYFLTFVLLIYVILLNLFTAVIIETFEKTHEQEEWKLSPQALEDFVTLWSEYDDGSGSIQPRHLEELLLKLDPPLGLGPYADNKDVLRFVYDLDIPLINGRVPFHKTAFELVKRCSQATMPEGAIKEQIDRLVRKFFNELASQDEMLNFSVAITVMKVQRKWRSRMRAAKLNRKKKWRRDRRDAPSYPEVVASRVHIVERFEAFREAQREAAKAWEQAQLAQALKPDKAELARRVEPRWRFNPKVAPQALVAAVAANEKSPGLLGNFGKRTITVNRLVGLLRGGLLGTGYASGDSPGGGGSTPMPHTHGHGGDYPGLVSGWTSPLPPGAIRDDAGGMMSPLPRLLMRAKTAYTSGAQISNGQIPCLSPGGGPYSSTQGTPTSVSPTPDPLAGARALPPGAGAGAGPAGMDAGAGGYGGAVAGGRVTRRSFSCAPALAGRTMQGPSTDGGPGSMGFGAAGGAPPRNGFGA